MARLAATTFVRNPDTQQMTELPAGSEPPPHLAALVTNPDCWEDGKLPAAAEQQDTLPDPVVDPADPADDEDAKPAAKRAATRPARGRKSAAGEGSSS